MTIFFISDTHFGHESIIRLSNRPFRTLAEMDSTLIDNWNSRVAPDDEVYHLGDFAFKSSRPCIDYLNKLNGHIHLVHGNHDFRGILRQPEALARLEEHADALTLIDGRLKLFMCHYPLAEPPRHVWSLYGHVHNNIDEEGFAAWPLVRTHDHSLNCSVDINGFAPVTFDELLINNERWRQENPA